MDKDCNVTDEEYAKFCEEMRYRIEAEGESPLQYMAAFVALAIFTGLTIAFLQMIGAIE